MGRYTNPRIRVYNDALTLQGTITTVLHAEFECRLDEIGEGYFVIPLVDTPGRQYCVENNIAVFTIEIDSTEVAFGQIVITDVDDKTEAAAGRLIVRGYGHLHKLTYDRMNYEVISDGSSGKSATARQDILDLSQYTWLRSEINYDLTPRVAGANLVSANETLFEAFLQAGVQDQFHVVDRAVYPPAHRVYGAKDMDQLSSTPAGAEDVYFRPDADDTDTDEIPIPDGGIRVVIERSQVPTRAYIYGGGGGQDRFTIEEADGLVSPPTGFSFDFTTSEVINDTLEAVSNQPVVSDNKNFPNIKPEDPNDATAVQTAAVALCEAGLSYLIERQQANQTFYEIDETFVGKVVWPGWNYCRLTFEYESPYNAAGSEVTTTIIDVDIQTHILGVRYVFGGDNVLKGAFLLGPAARMLPSGDREVSGRIQNLEQRLDHLTAAPSTSSPGGGGQTYANSDGQYLVLATNNILTNERQFVAGAGLAAVDAGANSTYTVNVAAADTSLTINADSMQVRLASPSGLAVSSGLQVADSIAGAGLTISSKVLAVGAGDGIDVAADSIAVDVTDIIGNGLVEVATNNIALGTPATLTVSTSNGVTASSHTHAITTSSAVSSSTAVILATDSNGRVRVQGLGVGAAAGTSNAITLPDDGWIGRGSGTGRIVFDAQTTDQIEFLSADVLIGSSSKDTNKDSVFQVLDGAALISQTGGSVGASLALIAYNAPSGSPFAGVQCLTSNGTRSTPTATTNGQILGRFGGGGYGASAFSDFMRGYVQAVATQNFTNSAQGTKLQWAVTPNGGTSTPVAMELSSPGTLRLGLADASVGTLALSGDTTGSNEGGEIQLDMAADHDGTYAYWRIDAWQDDLRLGPEGVTAVQIAPNGTVNFNQSGSVLQMNSTQVLKERVTGWTAPSGTGLRSGYTTGTATTLQVAQTLKALIDDLFTHGIIGN